MAEREVLISNILRYAREESRKPLSAPFKTNIAPPRQCFPSTRKRWRALRPVLKWVLNRSTPVKRRLTTFGMNHQAL